MWGRKVSMCASAISKFGGLYSLFFTGVFRGDLSSSLCLDNSLPAGVERVSLVGLLMSPPPPLCSNDKRGDRLR